MRTLFLFFVLAGSFSASAQKERDTVFRRCPLYITDTVSTYNFFLEAQPATLKVDRVKGDLVVEIQQRDQFFTIFFPDKKLKNTRYNIKTGSDSKKGVVAKYSFRSGEQVSYVDVSSGTIESSFDKEKNLWHLKINGLIANRVERSVTYYKVRAELYFK